MRHNLIQFLSLLTRIDSIFLYLKSMFSSRLCLVNLHLFQTTLRSRGITPSWVASVPLLVPSAPRALPVLWFREGKEDLGRIESFRLEVSSAVLGQSATNTDPVSRRPTDRTKSPAGSLVSEG